MANDRSSAFRTGVLCCCLVGRFPASVGAVMRCPDPEQILVGFVIAVAILVIVLFALPLGFLLWRDVLQP